MNGRDFLAVAKNLLAAPTEADWRTAVSRAYYAAFHVARQLLGDLSFRVPRADPAHAYLWMRLSNCGDPQIQAGGQRLHDLRSERNRADYDIDVPLAHTAAATQDLIARQLIQLLDTAAVDPLRTQITTAMRAYEQTALGVTTWHPP